MLGCAEVNITYQGQGRGQLPLLIVQGEGPTLLGRNWLQQIPVDLKMVNQVHSGGVEAVLDKYQEVFQEELGTLQGFEAHIEVDPNAKPQFCKARTVPYALREKVEEALQKLVEEGEAGRGRHVGTGTVLKLGGADCARSEKRQNQCEDLRGFPDDDKPRIQVGQVSNPQD